MGVKTGVLVFRRPENSPSKKAKASRKVWFYEVRADGYDPEKISGGVRPETPARNDIPDLLKLWRVYKDSKFKKPPGVEAGRLLDPRSDVPRCWWVTVKTISGSDYNLAAGRYRPQVAKPAPEEDPADLIREVLALEKDIAGGLKLLLKEVEQ